MSGGPSGGSGPIPRSPLTGLRNWLLTSSFRLQLLVGLVVLVGTVVVVIGALFALGGLSFQNPQQAGGGPTTPRPTPAPTPTPTPAPTPTPVPTPPDVVGDYRAATVVGATTGGVVTVQFDDGSVRRLPLAAVEVPDAGGDDPAAFDGVLTGEAGRACLGTYGTRATVDISDRLVGERVGARTVSDGTVPGGVGLLLRNDGRVVNRELVRRGYARATTDRYADAMVGAREGEQGLWECATVEPGARNGDVPATVAVRPTEVADDGGLRVIEIRPNPAGSGQRTVAGETITLRNTGERTVALDGWALGDDEGTSLLLSSFATPESRRLQPGERLVIHTGRGSPADGHLYLARSNELWGDDGGVVKLINRRGDPPRTITVRYGDAVPAPRHVDARIHAR